MLATALRLAALLSRHTGYAWGADGDSIRCTLLNGFNAQIGIYPNRTETDYLRRADWIIARFGR